MKSFVKALSLLLALTLLISLSACGGGSSNVNGSGSSATTDGTTQKISLSSQPVNPDEIYYGKYQEPITVNMVGQTYDDLDKELMAVNESFENNRWTKLMKDRLNIDIKYTFVANTSLFATKLNTMLASGEMPDILYAGPDQFKRLLDNDELADLTDVDQKYIGPEYKSIAEQDSMLLKSCTVNGKLMAFGASPTQPYGTASVLWLRYDWIKKLGLSEPKNMDDLFNIAKAFKDSNPDGVPITGGYGISGNILTLSFDLFCNAYHAYPRGKWVEKNGKLEYGFIQPEMKTALEALAKWYKAGLIDKEFLTKDEAKLNDEFVSGKIGMIGALDYYPLQIAFSIHWYRE